ncbi:ABC transporter ATP-binding protein [Psychromonas marina]|uniref:ABC transporter ATP-binding protein n=1 Tax=Psychromonas marina TaxID=88364 RepID=A0ABQ6E422_9GAMM|nr:sn-glycerol-3-phosphate ABC transporter ATP-binding protein UgpC [Psychromonas marina]GLS91756.1 ABC transporter ATP-binding protein [Psychromonas marina]
MASVQFSNLAKSYGDTPIVKEINLDIDHGEFIVLLGPSGCGKSTTLRMLAGLESISGGDIYIGEELVNDLHPIERNIAMVFQSYALYPHMTVEQNIGFSLENLKVEKAERIKLVTNVAEMLELTPLLDRKPKDLSGGQRQRVAMGRAMVRSPEVFLFDEPLSNLDAKLRGQMRKEIKAMHKKVQTTVIYVTHDQVEAMTLADRIVILNEGKIEQIGTPKQIFDQPKNTFVAKFIGAPAMNIFNLSNPKIQHDFGVSMGEHNPVLLGIRPQYLYLNENEVKGVEKAAFVDVEVISSELLGASRHIKCKYQDQTLVVETASHDATVKGIVRLYFNNTQIHLFDENNNTITH